MGFESPNFTTTFGGTGTLEGQQPAAALPVGTWVASAGTTGTAIVQNSVFAPGGGTQAVRVDRTANSENFWGVPVTGFPSSPSGVIDIYWDLLVLDAGGPSGAFGPYFNISAFDDTAGPVQLLASLGVDATTGDVLYQATSTGFLTESGLLINFGEWNAFQISLDYGAQQFALSVNGAAPFLVSGFVDGALTGFSDADISAIAAGGDPTSQGLPGTAYFDNFRVTSTAEVPEPGSLGLLGLGLLTAAVLKRRRRNA